MKQVIKNIRKVEWIEARMLKNVTWVHDESCNGVLLNFWRDWKTLPTVGFSECIVTSEVSDKSRLFTTVLKSNLSSHFEVRDRHLAFLITCVDGDRYLIGTDSHPFAVISTEDVMPSAESDRSGCSLSVEYKNTLGIFKVLD